MNFPADEETVMTLTSSPDILPTGLAADINGFLYSSEFGGGRVMKIDPM